MKKSIVLSVVFLTFATQVTARDLYIYNDTNEKISIKGPKKASNKAVVIPSEIEPGKVLIKDLDAEGTANDVLDLVYGGVASGNFKKFPKKYGKPVSIFKINWNAPQFAEISSETKLWDASAF